jgi:hypothetical protein
MEEITVTMPAWALGKIEGVASATGKTFAEVVAFLLWQGASDPSASKRSRGTRKG